jgi:hypothetical protein
VQATWCPRSRRSPPSREVATSSYFKVWGSSAQDVWITGQHASLLHGDGRSFTTVDLSASGAAASDPIFTVAGRGPDDVYLVGGAPRPLALHFDGAAWSRVPGLALDGLPPLTGVAVGADGAVAITGMGGVKIRGRGASWHDEAASAPGADLHAAWSDGAGGVFAVGGAFFTMSGGVVARAVSDAGRCAMD